MPPTTYTLAPASGWDSFSRSRELEECIWESLDRERPEDPWQYYNFTSKTSVWDSDVIGVPNQLSVTYASGRVSEIAFRVTESSSAHFREISALKDRLKVEFQLEETVEKES